MVGCDCEVEIVVYLENKYGCVNLELFVGPKFNPWRLLLVAAEEVPKSACIEDEDDEVDFKNETAAVVVEAIAVAATGSW